jgi:hypothetical protein
MGATPCCLEHFVAAAQPKRIKKIKKNKMKMTKKKKKKKNKCSFFFLITTGLVTKIFGQRKKMLKGTRAFENTNRAKGGAFFEMKKKKNKRPHKRQ